MRYPTRERYFANRFVRLLAKTCAANDIGCDAFALLVNVAMTEDVKRYSAPVTYTNEQLMPICGFGSKDRLGRARERAIAAGWLHYEPGRKGCAGRYWVLIPSHFIELPDGCTDGLSVRDSDAVSATATPNIPTGNRTESATESAPQSPPQNHSLQIPTGNRTESATESRLNPRPQPDGIRATLLPIPNPKPKEMRPRFEPPTIAEVREYCRERKNEVDPEQFHDHYTANGWVQGRGKPIREWKAAVRTWEKNGIQRSGSYSSQATATVSKPAQPIGYGRRSL